MVRGFRGDKIIDSSTSEDNQVVLSSSDCLDLIGLEWQFDLRQSLVTDHGIEPVYMIDHKSVESHIVSTNIQQVLYPSHPWMHSIHNFIKPRPIPAKEGIIYSVIPLILPLSSNIRSIRVSFNNFLQGLTFTLSNNDTHSVGNILGPYQDFSIGQNERICSIFFYQRHQTTIRTQVPGDILSVKVSASVYVDGLMAKLTEDKALTWAPKSPLAHLSTSSVACGVQIGVVL